MAGAAMQQFRLRWNNHQPNFISVFTTLLNSESLVDVTLGAEGKHVQAHKVVLSACSSYFQSLFTLNPCQHPIVILKDVKYDDLKVIVDFMYYGEVNVSQEQLPAILKTAEMLKVKGLAEMPAQNNISMSQSRSLSSDKGDDIATAGDSASGWGSDSVRHSPSPQPMSPAMRRKRLRKTSTGSGSGSTERTSEEQPVDINVVKAEPMSFQSEAESIKSSSSLRNSFQEASTESEPLDGSVETVEDPNIHSSQESVIGPNVDNPGSSSIYNPTPGKLGSKRGRLLMRQSRVKNLRDPRDSESTVTIAQASPESDDGSPHLHGCIKLEQSSPDRLSTNQPSSRGSSPGPLREVCLKREGSREKLTTVTVSSSGGQQLTVPGLRIERQSPDTKPLSSIPSPQTPSQSMSLLSVPTTYLVKQHSHPNLPSHSSAPLVNVVQRQHSQPSRLPTQHLMSSLSFERMSIESDNPPSSATVTASPSSTAGSAQLLRLVSEPPISLRRATSSPQSTSLDLGQSAGLTIEPARSGHCPVQREGPALGCNFCWNTIDNHGRTLRRKTKYHCPECKTNLCIVPCFQEYHEQQNKKEAALGSSPSGSVPSSMIRLLPKTSSI